MNKQQKDHRYLQIADVLKQKIQQGMYQIGEHLPTEKVICDQYDVSRYTARSALKYLIDLQLIERKQGSGSVVIATEPPLMNKSFMQDIDDLWQYGNTTRFKVFEQTRIDFPHCLPEYENGQYILLRGYRYVTSDITIPFCITDIFLWTDDDAVASALLSDDEPTNTLMSYLSPRNLQKVEQILRAIGLTEDQAEILQKSNNQVGLYAERKYFDNHNRHIATASSVHSGDKYQYATVLHRKHH